MTILRVVRHTFSPALLIVFFSVGFSQNIGDLPNVKHTDQEAIDNGMNLVSINNQEEQNIIQEWLYDFPNIDNIYWIGLNDVESEGDWVWTDGSEAN